MELEEASRYINKLYEKRGINRENILARINP